jgi:hypothetical protein
MAHDGSLIIAEASPGGRSWMSVMFDGVDPFGCYRLFGCQMQEGSQGPGVQCGPNHIRRMRADSWDMTRAPLAFVLFNSKTT